MLSVPTALNIVDFVSYKEDKLFYNLASCILSQLYDRYLKSN